MTKNSLKSKAGLLLRRFAGDARGNVAVVATIAALPLMVGAGIAIDYARVARSQSALQVAVDAATLAAASSDKLSMAGLNAAQKTARKNEIADLARSFVKSNYSDEGVDTVIDVTVTETTVSVQGTQAFPTTLMSLAGINTVDIAARAEVNLQGGIAENIEIVLVMDITGSMKGTKIADAKSAAKALIQKVLDDKTSDDKVRFALVPFSGSVNVGADKLNSGWIDTTGKAAVSKVNFTDATYHNMKGWNELKYRNSSGQSVQLPWNGCVEARLGALATNDTAPSSATSNTLFTPYFAPDEPNYSNSDYSNSYVDDGVTGTDTARLKNQAKYKNKILNRSSLNGPWKNCAVSPIIPLTKDRADVEDGIDDMVAEGSTNLVEGIMWGWRTLSPEAPYTEGKSFEDKEWRKVVVLMTDGENDVGTNQSWSMPPAATGTLYTAFGYSKVALAKNRFGTDVQSQARGKVDAAFQTACANLKAFTKMRENKAGQKLPSLEVYTIGFQVKTEWEQPLRDCASDPELNGGKYQYYVKADNKQELEGAFEAIGARLKSMYLSK